MEENVQNKQLISILEELSGRLQRQNSYTRVFLTGVLYGIGFFIGSAIIATIAIGLIRPWVGKILGFHPTAQVEVTTFHQ